MTLLETIVCGVGVWSQSILGAYLLLESLASCRPTAATAKPAQIVSAPVEASGGHGRLSLFSRLSEICSSAQVPIQYFMDESSFESLDISVGEVQSVGSHDAAILVLDLDRDLVLQRFYIHIRKIFEK